MEYDKHRPPLPCATHTHSYRPRTKLGCFGPRVWVSHGGPEKPGLCEIPLETRKGRNERGKGVTCDLKMPRWPLGLVRARAKRLFVTTAVISSKRDSPVT